MERQGLAPYTLSRQSAREPTMAKVEIYTTGMCGFCYRAKRLLESKGVDYEETDVTFNPDKRAAMTARSGSRTVPQIWINGRFVGGSDDLYALEEEGKLDTLLGETA